MSTVPDASQPLLSEGLSRLPSGATVDSSPVLQKPGHPSSIVISGQKRKAATTSEAAPFQNATKASRITFKIARCSTRVIEAPKSVGTEGSKALPAVQEKAQNSSSAKEAIDQAVSANSLSPHPTEKSLISCIPPSETTSNLQEIIDVDSDPESVGASVAAQKTLRDVAVQIESLGNTSKTVNSQKTTLSDKSVATEEKKIIANSSSDPALDTPAALQVLGENKDEHSKIEFDPDWEKKIATLNGELIKKVGRSKELKGQMRELEETLETIASAMRKCSSPWEKLVKEIDEVVQAQLAIQEEFVVCNRALSLMDRDLVHLRNQYRERQMKIMLAGKGADSQAMENFQEVAEDSFRVKRGDVMEKISKLRERMVIERFKLSEADAKKKKLEVQISKGFEEFRDAKHRVNQQEKEILACGQEISDIQSQMLELKRKELMYRFQLIKSEPVGTLVFPCESVVDEETAENGRTPGSGLVVPAEIIHDFMHTLVVFRSSFKESADDPAFILNLNLDEIKIKSLFDRMVMYFPGRFTESKINYVLRSWQEQLEGLNSCNLCITVAASFDHDSVKSIIKDIRRFYIAKQEAQKPSGAEIPSYPSTPATPSLLMPQLQKRTVNTSTPLVECSICRQPTSMSCACQSVAYCSTDCQVQDFTRHQEECQFLATERQTSA